MEFKGQFGKEIETGENYVVIKKKSFLFKSYEKKIPLCKIRGIDIIEPTFGSIGFIRFVEADDKRSFYSEKEYSNFAVSDENSVLFKGNKNYKAALALKEFLEVKADNQTESSSDENIVLTTKKGNLKFVVLSVILFYVLYAIFNKERLGLTSSVSSKEKTAVTKTLSYSVVNSGGTSKYVVIDSAFVNSDDLKKLGDKLKSDFHSADPIQVYVFDDEAVAKEWNEYSLKDESNEAKDKHFVALYWKGGVRHDLWVMPEGLNGERETVTYEKRKARYHVNLQGVSVRMEDGAFKITNKSGQDLTNVEMIINIDSNKYTAKTNVIKNGNTLSAGMMTFANKKDELFNPFAIKVKSLSIYSDQGNLWVYAN